MNLLHERPFLFILTSLVNAVLVVMSFLSLHLLAALVISILLSCVIWIAFFSYTKIYPKEFFLFAIPVSVLCAFVMPRIDRIDAKVIVLIFVGIIAYGVYLSKLRQTRVRHEEAEGIES